MILAAENCNCPLEDSGLSVVNSPICSGMALFMILIEGYIRGRCDIASPCQRLESPSELESEYDFIVVGAGAAGSIVAGRLSENDKFKVLLLEAGGPEPIGARIPSFYRAFWSNEEVDWRYRTVPEDYCLDQGGLGCLWPRGKVVGGSNLLNGMMYHRGHAADYDDWVAAGAEGWSWDENKKYFDMTEGNKQIGSLVRSEYHSSTGPLPIQQFNEQPPFLYELMNAINETGIPILADMNDPNTPDGFMIAQTMNEDGQRYTTARAYLKPQSERPNLTVKTKAHVAKVLIDNNQAKGIEYIDENGNTKTVKANKEVILSAGALNSPQILLLSGIGPKESLDSLNIPVVADLPVGKNMRNHYGLTLYFLVTKLENRQVLDWATFTEYILKRTGPMSSSSITQLTGLLYSSLADQSKKQPDIQFFFNGFYAECSKTGVIGEPVGDDDCYLDGRNISANAALLLPRSVGNMTLKSTDPLEQPIFYPGYFTHAEDMVMMRDGARYLQRIFDSDIMREKYGVKLDPAYDNGCSQKGAEWSDAWIECMARVHTDPQNHQLGTAAMGLVLDPQLRVKGVKGLRVADASAMPTQPTGNPQAAIMLVAEKAAELIKHDYA